MNKRFPLFTIILIVLSFFTKADASIDNWKLYPSYMNVTYCEPVGKQIYVLASGALYSFGTDDNEVRTYNKVTTLNDIEITHIAHSEFLNALIIIYSNANIDILFDDETVYNISDFKNKILPKKKINNINIQGSTAYISTEFGIVELNLEKLEFTNTYNLDINTYSSCKFKDKIYAGTATGFYSCDTVKNPLDKGNWVRINNNPVKALTTFKDELYCLIENHGIFIYTPTNYTLTKFIADNGVKYYSIKNYGNELVAMAKNKTTVISSDKKTTTFSNSGNSSHTAKKGDNYWDCKGYNGIVEYIIKDNKIQITSEIPQPNSPIRNYCEFMKISNDGRLFVAGGNLNYFDVNFYDGTLMEYNTKEDKWYNFPEEEIKKKTELRYVNICSVDEDPTESGHFFASSFGLGVYEFRNGEFINHYNDANSNLESVVPGNHNYVRVSTVKFDNDGNLWCINTGVKDIVKILTKDGEWINLEYKDIEYMSTMVKPYIDSRGWLWITSLQGDAGIFCAITKNTIFDTSDDETKKWLNKFTNQDGISYDIYQVYDIVEDKNGYMWVATNTGVFIIDNPIDFFLEGIFKQIKVARNDGTGLADYFMNGEYIKDIEVDGADRKWIGTNDNGIYLVSSNAQETIHHFTTENSPIPSNSIESIAINDITGEVFIGTDKGIVSYMSNATKPEEKLDDDNIHVYPNPVTANYNGKISITGLTADCNVKIVDAAGFLVNEGTSHGGQYSWNGRDKRGEKVTSGVYYVLTYDEQWNEGATTKILITR